MQQEIQHQQQHHAQLLLHQVNQLPIHAELKKRLVQSFKLFDADRSLTLSRTESFAAMLAFLPGTPAVELQKMFDRADTNKDGVIDIVEWSRLALPFIEKEQKRIQQQQQQHATASPITAVAAATTTSGSYSPVASSAARGVLCAEQTVPSPPVPPAAPSSSENTTNSPSPPSSSAAFTSSVSTFHRERLIAFYTKHDPSKLASVDAILARYAGNEEDVLWPQLRIKYGEGGGDVAIANSAAASRQLLLSHRERLLAFYAKYEPGKVHTVNETLTKYEGKEDWLWTALTNKYGPEPSAQEAAALLADLPSRAAAVGTGAGAPAAAERRPSQPAIVVVPAPATLASSPSSSSSPAVASLSARDRAVAFFLKYDPTRVRNLDHLLQKFVGKEIELWQQLVGKYGPEPSVEEAAALLSDSTASRGSVVVAAPAAPAAATIPDRPGSQQITSSTATTTTAAAGTAPDFYSDREKLIDFYAKFDPPKLESGIVDTVLAKYAGREHEIWGLLCKKYALDEGTAQRYLGEVSQQQQQEQQQQQQLNYSSNNPRAAPVSTSRETAAPPAKPAAPQPATIETEQPPHLQRLLAFYKRYDPSKLPSVEQILGKYRGNEALMWSMLTHKYGPEPSAEEAAVIVKESSDLSLGHL